MRILSFQKKWDKLTKDSNLTTFRYPRGDKDWQVGELVQIIFQPRRKGGGDKLGIAEIISKEVREFDEEYLEKISDDHCPLITEEEAIKDGFVNIGDMID